MNLIQDTYVLNIYIYIFFQKLYFKYFFFILKTTRNFISSYLHFSECINYFSPYVLYRGNFAVILQQFFFNTKGNDYRKKAEKQAFIKIEFGYFLKIPKIMILLNLKFIYTFFFTNFELFITFMYYILLFYSHFLY